VKKSEFSNGGCDCIGLIIGVASVLDIKCKGLSLHDIDTANYSKIPDGQSLKNTLDSYLTPIPISNFQPGNILLLKITQHPQHVAFVGDYAGGGLSLIHCYIQARGVIEHVLDDYWRARIIGAYEF
jgi:hypothetical protein